MQRKQRELNKPRKSASQGSQRNHQYWCKYFLKRRSSVIFFERDFCPIYCSSLLND
jgi:hypothetical protein